MKHKVEKLKTILRNMERVIVAFSGGIDSTYLLKVAKETLGNNAMAVTLVSPSIPPDEVEEARRLANTIGINHRVLESHETEDTHYQENSPDRCYFCRHITFQQLLHFGQENGFDFIVDGANADDIGDHRPGRRAAQELGVRSPLLEAGLEKSEIRELARNSNLPNWNKPSAACLSSRIPYGTQISTEVLSQVLQAETCLKNLGFSEFRVRHHGDLARIEVPPEDFSIILNNRDEIIQSFKNSGYTYVTLDLSGFRSGSMNEVL